MRKSTFEGGLEIQVGVLIKRVQQALRGRMDRALDGYRLTTPKFAVLSHLKRAPGLSNAELARRSFVTAPTMIRIVQDLETLGYVERRDSGVHKRVIEMTLTAKGKKIVDSCEAVISAIQNQMTSGMKSSEIAELRRLLTGCAERLETE